jgi:hypothetical protein
VKNNSEHLKTIECFNCGKNVTILLKDELQEKMTMRIQRWYPKRISKTIPIFFERHVEQKGKTDKEERQHGGR